MLVWNFIETIFHQQLGLPVLDPTVGTFQEYAWVTIRARVIILGVLGVLMLFVNLSKEFAALRYLSIFILVTILVTIGVSNNSY